MAEIMSTHRIERWRLDVAASAAPVVIRSNNRAFRKGVPAPEQVEVDDGMSFKSTTVKSAGRPRVMERRASSDRGGYSRRKQSPSRTRYDRRDDHDRYSKRNDRDRYSPPSKPSTSIWSSFLPSSRSSRGRAVTYERKPSPRRSITPEYRPRRRAEPEVTVYTTRPRSVYAPARAPARSGTVKSSRRDSAGVDERMRLLDIRDRFRDEINKARNWQGGSPRTAPARGREYDRRSLHY